ncbi:3-oxoacyl-[acyl-carrier-protein] synthase 3 [Paenibacillus sp. CECT 9249]|uniref:beta-ketoacyl-ACP synthase III n=1 Tax=Paenibacillus sp. CECT 9249 TaxID=2845385 RepID=UPI001E543675|nr:beta-ketoacyl-ACP synthase III [Paenibacillus sp. CECT 9249]CAH0120879.1 3-oxoacyl-[acyl-carrier-protein] synthase 3 [Paenibacillus sp. CECT 9249]
MQLRKVKIVGTGKYLPKRTVTDEEMDRLLGIAKGWVRSKANVCVRHFAERETASEMGAQAAYAALENAGLAFGDIDCLVCASGTMQQPIPCTAALIQKAMGQEQSGVPCFDINSTCLSFVVGLDVMSYLVQAGRYRRVLFVATEIASAGLNWKQKESAALFGDGAAAVIVERSGEGESAGIVHSSMQTFGQGAAFSEIRGGGSGLHASRYEQAGAADYLFDMNGPAMFKFASKLLPGFVDRLLGEAGVRMGDFRAVIPHQGSAMAMRLMCRKLGIHDDQLMDITADHGNTIAASIPMGIHEAIRRGRINRGDRVLLLGTSAGLSIGGMILDY